MPLRHIISQDTTFWQNYLFFPLLLWIYICLCIQKHVFLSSYNSKINTKKMYLDFLMQRWRLKYFCSRILVWGVLVYNSSFRTKTIFWLSVIMKGSVLLHYFWSSVSLKVLRCIYIYFLLQLLKEKL